MLAINWKYALRSLLGNPGYTLAAVLALGIGIGLNTAMFSVVDGILLKPLPFAEPERLVQVRERMIARGGNPIPLAAGNFYDYRAQSKTAELVAYKGNPFSWAAKDGDPERYIGVAVTEGWFGFLGVKLVRGRDFLPEDFQVGKDEAVVIGFGLWQEKFGGRDSALGSEVILNGRKRRIVGVAAEGFDYPAKSKIWAPLAVEGADRTRRDLHNLLALGRLRPGVSLEQARGELAALLQGMAERFPDMNNGKQSAVTPLLDDLTGPLRPALWALLGAVGFVLAIACANVANLLLARGATRAQELAVRASLGASRLSLAAQLMAESLLLAIAGGLLGVGVAYGAFRAFRAYAPITLPRVDTVALDGRVLLFGLLAVLATGVVFGLVPALRLSRVDLGMSMRERSRGASGRSLFRNGLVVAQVAAALVLMTGAGLLIRSMYQLSRVDLGFTPTQLVTMRVTPLPSKYAENVNLQVQFGRNLVERLRAVPGVSSVALSTDLPLQGNPRFIMRIEGKPPVTVATAPVADYFTVTPGYFDTMKIAVKQGREFRDSDGMPAPRVVLVNEEFVRAHFPKENPIGKRLEIGISDPPQWREIVGVVSNVRNLGVDQPSRVQVYGCYWQGPGIIPAQAPSFSVIGRTKASSDNTSEDLASGVAQAMRRAVLEVDNAQPVWNVQTMQETVNSSIARERFTLFLMAVFAGVAFLLAVIGLSGVMTYTVTQRTREIGIRMAVGARPGDVLWMVERQALGLVAIGVALGLAGSVALARSLRSLLFEVSPYDPLTFAGMAAVFLVTALVSGFVPATRAAAIDPAITLRAE